MDKLKKILSPGNSKDDEVMYGKPTESSTGGQSSSTTEAPQLVTDPESDQKSHGILRQILNPDGNKYSEESHGTTAHEASSAGQAPVGQLVTDPGAGEKSHGIGRQILNPGGSKYSEQSHGTTATMQTGTMHSSSTAEDDASVLSIKSGKVGPYAGGADTPPLDQSQPSTLPQTQTSTLQPIASSTTRQEDSSQWRDSTLAGIGAAGAGTGAAAGSEGIVRENKGDDVTDSTYTARSYQLSSGQATEPLGPDRTVEPLNTGDPPQTGSSDYVRDGSLAGAGTIIGAGTVSANDLAAQENKPQDDEVANATYTARAYPIGVHDPSKVDFRDPVDPTQSSSQFGPHVPGEFPTETGEDPHAIPGAFPETPAEPADREFGSGTAVATGVGAGAVGAGIVGAAATRAGEPPVTSESSARPGADGFPIMTPTNSIPHAESASRVTQPESDTHYGRDAAIGGAALAGTGAAGYGIYEATKGDSSNNYQNTQDRINPPANVVQPSQTEPQTVSGEEPRHHYGRDAAIIGGGTAATGAAGYGVYEATKGSDSTTLPQDQTSRNAAVPPTQYTAQPSASTGTQPPPVEPEHHYGRDAAVAGGATAATGAAGYGIYEATRSGEPQSQITQTQPPPQSLVEPARSQPMTQEPIGQEPVKVERAKPAKLQKQEKVVSEPTRPAQTSAVEPTPEDNNYGRNAALAGGATAATGAAGYGAYEATRDDPMDTGPAPNTIGPHKSDVANVLDPRVKPDPEKMRGDQSAAEPSMQQSHPNETNHGRDAAIVGGTGAAGAAGYGAYNASHEERDSLDSSNNKVSTDERGHHHLHKKSAEQQGEKKHGLVSRILHPSRTKREKEEAEARHSGSYERPAGYDSAHQQSEHVGTDGPIGNSHHVSGMTESKPQPAAGSDEQYSSSAPTTGPSTTSTGEQDMITIVHEGADPNAPHAVVR